MIQSDTKNMDQTYENDIRSAQAALRIEIESLQQLSDNLANNLGGDFSKALDMMAAIKGRVIVTGMGKSGHVGRKMAATFASTGTPAFFVHPGEASHGDLGMVTENDLVIAISNSGEAPELSDILAYCKRFRIPLVGITSKKDSSLDRHADITVFLPEHKEACPNGLAPTTSTTLTIALGDAMAIALMQRRQFSSGEYKVFHPGGKLGKRLLKVSDLMHKGDSLPLVASEDLMQDVLITMTEKGFGCAVIVKDQNSLIGLISDGDLRRHMGPDLPAKKASAVMTPDPKTIGSDHLAAEALAVMNEKSITFLIVSDEKTGKLAGIIRMHDILRAGVA